MKKTLKNLVALITIGLASLVPAKADINGWLEASLGTPAENLRLYPSASLKSVKLQSLIDINNYWKFSKTDLLHEKVKANIGGFEFKPIATFYTDPYDKQLMAGVNASYANDRGFGFFELSVNPSYLNKSQLFSYNSLGTKIGNLALFTQTANLKDFKSTYAEIEFNSNIKKNGIHPYARMNLQKGVKPTYQIGISITPREVIGK